MAGVTKSKKVLVGLSGGVDSSVAATLLKKQGYAVEGAYMHCWGSGPYCTAVQDQADAAAVAATLDISFHVFNFEKEYKEAVIDKFFKEYKAGRTPNPDVLCNKEIKFGLFLKKALSLGFDYIATGHYARIRDQGTEDREQQTKDKEVKNTRIRNTPPTYQLLTGLDQDKDQSYFLYLLGQEQLARTLFPLGNLTKKEVRKLALEFGLPTANKPDSTGICFVGEAPIKEFLLQKIKIRRGDIVSNDGKLLGKHIGVPFYTIGQREGLGISATVPYYVSDKQAKTNTLVAVPFGHEALFKDKFIVTSAHWITGREPKYPLKIEVKLRYRSGNISAIITQTDSCKYLEVTLEQSARAITPGQAAVFYSGEEVLGGAVIEKVIE